MATAHNKAMQQLTRLHPLDFKRLYDEQRLMLGLPVSGSAGRVHVPPQLRSQRVSAPTGPEVCAGVCAHKTVTLLNGGMARCSGCGLLRGRDGTWRAI